MKPELEKIQEVHQTSFTLKKVIRENRPLLTQAWHYHPEIEICFTRKSIGKRYVGNNISQYEEGDLVMFGELLPHGFTTVHQCEQIVIQLDKEFLGASFFNKPELRRVNELLNQSKMGLHFFGKTNKEAIKIINAMMNKEGFQRLIHLLKLLHLLANSKEYKLICSREYSANLNLASLSRIKKVFDFIENNYERNITVEHAASLINLTESAFYKFIKKHTKKKFTQIVNEFRVNKASKLLINSEMTIAEICYNCGYNNLSYFNRKFKEIIGERPSQFRSKYLN